jgi:hypothetical protein
MSISYQIERLSGRDFIIRINKKVYKILYRRLKSKYYTCGHVYSFENKLTDACRTYSSHYKYSTAKKQFIDWFLEIIKKSA